MSTLNCYAYEKSIAERCLSDHHRFVYRQTGTGYHSLATKLEHVFIRELWQFIQQDDFYKNKTTLIITTDHGRGTTPLDQWQHHNQTIANNDDVWLAFIDLDIDSLDDVKVEQKYLLKQISVTIAELIGVSFESESRTGKSFKNIIVKELKHFEILKIIYIIAVSIVAISMNIENVILFQIEKTSKISKLYSQREFDRLGMRITVEQWILLKIIEENDGLTQKELADKSIRDPASITRTLDLLNKKSFVERRPVEGNRRQYNICLKKEGADFIAKYMDVISSHRAKSIEGISEQELSILKHLLEKIQQNMQ